MGEMKLTMVEVENKAGLERHKRVSGRNGILSMALKWNESLKSYPTYKLTDLTDQTEVNEWILKNVSFFFN